MKIRKKEYKVETVEFEVFIENEELLNKLIKDKEDEGYILMDKLRIKIEVGTFETKEGIFVALQRKSNATYEVL